MSEYRFLMKKFVWIFMLSSFMCGCEKEFKGYEKIVGTATINGMDYKESTWWAWNFKGYPSSMILYENYKVLYFISRLSPKDANNPQYNIHFYVSVDDSQFNINDPYKIDFYRELEIKSTYWGDNIPYFSENKNKILSEDADGFAFATSTNSDEVIPLKGELVLESIDSQSTVCHGYYSFTSPENKPDKLVIEGKFETVTSISKALYKILCK